MNRNVVIEFLTEKDEFAQIVFHENGNVVMFASDYDEDDPYFSFTVEGKVDSAFCKDLAARMYLLGNHLEKQEAGVI